jgi:hypothetical protein
LELQARVSELANKGAGKKAKKNNEAARREVTVCLFREKFIIMRRNG